MWHNTGPLKDRRTIHFMNEHSFTFLLAFPLACVEPEMPDHLHTLRHCYLGGFMRLIHLLRVFLAGLLLTGMVYAQGVGASGDIRGTVTDPSGAVITNANVTATDIAKGIKHTVATDNN